jgi:hypothetical protein
VIGTVIEQGRSTQNPNMLAYGEEGELNPDSHLYAVNDTFVNDLRRGDAIFVGSQVTQPVLAENDISTGSAAFVSQPGARTRHDCITNHPGFEDPAHHDYRLSATSPCWHVGVKPGSINGFSLVPCFQYVPVAGHVNRTDGGTIAGALGS